MPDAGCRSGRAREGPRGAAHGAGFGEVHPGRDGPALACAAGWHVGNSCSSATALPASWTRGRGTGRVPTGVGPWTSRLTNPLHHRRRKPSRNLDAKGSLHWGRIARLRGANLPAGNPAGLPAPHRTAGTPRAPPRGHLCRGPAASRCHHPEPQREPQHQHAAAGALPGLRERTQPCQEAEAAGAGAPVEEPQEPRPSQGPAQRSVWEHLPHLPHPR